MLSLGIPLNMDESGDAVFDLNSGGEVLAKNSPRDTDFGLVAFHPGQNVGQSVMISELVSDIAKALSTLDEAHVRGVKKQGWYKRLNLYSSE